MAVKLTEKELPTFVGDSMTLDELNEQIAATEKGAAVALETFRKRNGIVVEAVKR